MSMHNNILILCCLLLFGNSLGLPLESSDENASILMKCLSDKNRAIATSDLQMLESFASWNESERLPCLSHCLSTNKGWFNASSGQWIRSKLEADLSSNVYRYCKQELERSYENVCDFVYNGFKCLREAASHIVQAYMTLLDCGIELHANLKELQNYITFPADEPIACMFQCFAKKFDLYTSDYEWNLDNWIKALGPLKATANPSDYEECRANAEDRNDEGRKCIWMYKEFLCLKNVNEHEEV